jgi:hypothetical protein
LVSTKSLSCILPTGSPARRRLPSRGSRGPWFPTFTGTMRRYDCHRSLSGRFTCRSLPDTLRAPRVRGVPEGLAVWSKRPNGARAFGHPVPRSGHVVKETDGSPKFPSSPCEDMPRSQTPVVSCALAIAHPGLLPSSACKPSASHDYTHFGAPSRGLPSRYTRLRTAPCGEARGFATDLLARRSSGGTCTRCAPTGKQQPISWSNLQSQGFGLTLARACLG